MQATIEAPASSEPAATKIACINVARAEEESLRTALKRSSAVNLIVSDIDWEEALSLRI